MQLSLCVAMLLLGTLAAVAMPAPAFDPAPIQHQRRIDKVLRHAQADGGYTCSAPNGDGGHSSSSSSRFPTPTIPLSTAASTVVSNPTGTPTYDPSKRCPDFYEVCDCSGMVGVE